MSRTLFILSLLLFFAACGDEGDTSASPDSPETKSTSKTVDKSVYKVSVENRSEADILHEIMHENDHVMVPRTLILRPIDAPEGGMDVHYRFICGKFGKGEITYVGEPKKMRFEGGRTLKLSEKILFEFAGHGRTRVLVHAEGFEPSVYTFGEDHTKASFQLRPMSTFRITPRIAADKEFERPVNVVTSLQRYSEETVAEMLRFVTQKDAIALGKGAPYYLCFNDDVPLEKERLVAKTTVQGTSVDFTNLPYSPSFSIHAYANGFSSTGKKLKAEKRLHNLTLNLTQAFGCEVLAYQETRAGKRSPASNATLIYTMREHGGKPSEVHPSETNRHFLYATVAGSKMHDIVVFGQSKDPETGKVFISNPPLKVAEADHQSTHAITLREAYPYQVSGFGVKDGKEGKVDFADLHISVLAGGNEWILIPGKESRMSEPFYSLKLLKEFKIRIEPTSDKRVTSRFKPEDIKRWESQTFTFDKDQRGEFRLVLS